MIDSLYHYIKMREKMVVGKSLDFCGSFALSLDFVCSFAPHPIDAGIARHERKHAQSRKQHTLAPSLQSTGKFQKTRVAWDIHS